MARTSKRAKRKAFDLSRAERIQIVEVWDAGRPKANNRTLMLRMRTGLFEESDHMTGVQKAPELG